jgi:hypothetical protein
MHLPRRGPLAGMTLDELRQAAGLPAGWIWDGYLAPGCVTLLTSQWKAGKTTFVAVLLDRLREGGTLGGLPVARGRAVIVSEEGPSQWVRRADRLGFGNHLYWICRPFRGKPRFEQWEALIDRLAELHDEWGATLAVIDPLAAFLPGQTENSAGSMLAAVLALQQLTARGLAVLLLHHPRKGACLPGQWARGSGALSGYVDILIEMLWYGRAGDGDRRRRLQAYSRFEETPLCRVLELNEAGTDYRPGIDPEDEAFGHGWTVLLGVLDDAPHKLTRQAIQANWPDDFGRPGDTTLWRWLTRATAEGRIVAEGTGRKNDPFRYWLPGKLEEWQRDPLGLVRMGQGDVLKEIERSTWQRKGRRSRS